jgi:hypothetical protein
MYYLCVLSMPRDGFGICCFRETRCTNNVLAMFTVHASPWFWNLLFLETRCTNTGCCLFLYWPCNRYNSGAIEELKMMPFFLLRDQELIG